MADGGAAAPRWTDDHCHLHHSSGSHVDHDAARAADVAAVVEASVAVGVERIVTVGPGYAIDAEGREIVLLEEPRKLLVRQVHPDHLRRCLGGREEYSPHPREALREHRGHAAEGSPSLAAKMRRPHREVAPKRGDGHG